MKAIPFIQKLKQFAHANNIPFSCQWKHIKAALDLYKKKPVEIHTTMLQGTLPGNKTLLGKQCQTGPGYRMPTKQLK